MSGFYAAQHKHSMAGFMLQLMLQHKVQHKSQHNRTGIAEYRLKSYL
jgi:hypothetical protein